MLRSAIGLTPTEIGTRIGRTRAFVSMAESGATELGRETVIRLFDEFRDDLNRLGITAEDLLRGETVRHDNAPVSKRRRKPPAWHEPEAVA